MELFYDLLENFIGVVDLLGCGCGTIKELCGIEDKPKPEKKRTEDEEFEYSIRNKPESTKELLRLQREMDKDDY